MLAKFLDPKNDVAFKRIFGTEKHKNILIHFLNDMLGFSNEEKIRQISFLKPVQDPDIASKKQSIVDVLCTDEQGSQYIAKITGSDEIIRQAYEILNQFSWSKEELNIYEQEKKRELDAKAILLQQRIEGRVEGLAEGIEKGKKRALLAVAKEMLDQGVEIKRITQFTNLSEQEILSIRMGSIQI